MTTPTILEQRPRGFEPDPWTAAWTVGLDLGQAHDYTAWAVVRTVLMPTGRTTMVTENWIAAWRAGRPQWTEARREMRPDHRLLHLERVRGVSYPKVVAQTGEILRQLRAVIARDLPAPESRHYRRMAERLTPSLAVDATGVGQPVVDLLLAAELPARVRPITITGGDAVTRDGAAYRVPKRDLASAIAVVLEGGRLRWPADLPLRGVLEAELRAFKAKISVRGHDTYGAGGTAEGWRERPHDDAVLAVGLAVWLAEFS